MALILQPVSLRDHARASGGSSEPGRATSTALPVSLTSSAYRPIATSEDGALVQEELLRAKDDVAKLRESLHPLILSDVVKTLDNDARALSDGGSNTSSLVVDQALASCIRSMQLIDPPPKSSKFTGNPQPFLTLSNENAVLTNQNLDLTTRIRKCNNRHYSAQNELTMATSASILCAEELKAVKEGSVRRSSYNNTLPVRNSNCTTKMPWLPPSRSDPTGTLRNEATRLRCELSFLRTTSEALHLETLELRSNNRKLLRENRLLTNRRFRQLPRRCRAWGITWLIWRFFPALVYSLLLCSSVFLYTYIDTKCVSVYEEECNYGYLSHNSSLLTSSSSFWRPPRMDDLEDGDGRSLDVSVGSLEMDSLV